MCFQVWQINLTPADSWCSDTGLKAKELHKLMGFCQSHSFPQSGGETKGSFPQPQLTPLTRASVSPSLKQRQPWLTMSAIEEITTLHSLLLTLEWHFLYQEWVPQQGIYTWLQDKLAFHPCLLRIPHRGVGRINYLACAEGFEDKMCQVITMCFTDLGMHGHFLA